MILTIYSENHSTEYPFSAPALLSDLLTHAGIPFALPCGGRRQCLACRVQVTGTVSPPTAQEEAFLDSTALNSGVRYACMTTVTGDASVYLPQAGQMSIQEDGILTAVALYPLGKRLGIAFDIGTTTIAGYLWDLSVGKRLAAASLPNPQRLFGADVISRMEHALSGAGKHLATLVRDALNQLIQTLLSSAERPAADLDTLVITGNTVMEYLLTERNPQTLSRSPFLPDCLFGQVLLSTDLSLSPSDAPVYLMRSISAFVGADITAGILACRLTERARPVLLMDIGTNGEMALWTGNTLLCCATSAGPALEAVGISCGCPALDGAIAQVTLRESDGERYLSVETIGHTEASGICGSGLIDAAAVFAETGLLDPTGRIDPDADDMGYITADGRLRVGDTEIFLTQADIRALQLAKSAICSGAETLLHRAGLPVDALETVYLAGGFGSKLNVSSAERIGLLPDGFASKTVAVGNAAGAGAGAVLLNRILWERTLEIADRAQTLNLAEDALFQQKFMENMRF